MPGNTSRCAPLERRIANASMRPQRNAGEYPISDPRVASVTLASMRPQRNAGEYLAVAADRAGGRRASMRPQRNAGEYDAVATGPKPNDGGLQ